MVIIIIIIIIKVIIIIIILGEARFVRVHVHVFLRSFLVYVCLCFSSTTPMDLQKSQARGRVFLLEAPPMLKLVLA